MAKTVDELLKLVENVRPNISVSAAESIREQAAATDKLSLMGFNPGYPATQQEPSLFDKLSKVPRRADLFCENVLQRASNFKNSLPEGTEMLARVILPDGSSVAIANIHPLNGDAVVCIGVNQAGLPAEVVVSVSGATLKLEAVPASEEYARQERVGFLSTLSPHKDQQES